MREVRGSVNKMEGENEKEKEEGRERETVNGRYGEIEGEREK